MGDHYVWAINAIKGLHWLAHVDDWAFQGARENLGGRDPDVIDVAHVRWATTTAITAIDLCAFDLAVRHGCQEFWTENAPTFGKLRKELKAHGISRRDEDWLDSVHSDPDYKLLRRRVRDPLTHRLMIRTALIRMGKPVGHDERTRFELERDGPPGERPDARELIHLALDVAERHVGEFRRILGNTSSPPPLRP